MAPRTAVRAIRIFIHEKFLRRVGEFRRFALLAKLITYFFFPSENIKLNSIYYVQFLTIFRNARITAAIKKMIDFTERDSRRNEARRKNRLKLAQFKRPLTFVILSLVPFRFSFVCKSPSRYPTPETPQTCFFNNVLSLELSLRGDFAQPEHSTAGSRPSALHSFRRCARLLVNACSYLLCNELYCTLLFHISR